MQILRIFLCLLMLILLSRCAPLTPYVASSYEPVLVEQKKQVQCAAGIRPSQYAYVDLTYAFTERFAARASLGGVAGLVNITASILDYRLAKRTNPFIGILFNFQNNELTRSATFFGNKVNYHYSCTYYAPGAVIGIGTRHWRDLIWHFMVRGQYNIVGKYDYHWQERSPGDMGHVYVDNENLTQKLKSFWSVEPMLTLTISKNKLQSLKFQFGVNLCQTTAEHIYGFNDPPDKTVISRLHPVSRSLNFSIGYIFCSKKKWDDKKS